MKLTSDDRKYIIKKTFYLIDNFYTFLERSNLNTLEYEAYNKKFILIFKEYIVGNTIEILNIINDKDFELDTDFNLTLTDFE